MDDAVVDPHLRVGSVQRLRVADSSIMRLLLSRNTNAPNMIIGKQAADMINSTVFNTWIPRAGSSTAPAAHKGAAAVGKRSWVV
ncbi:hypothetical protein GR212_33475 [Rhizobium lusitanum]|uniref:Glucose-methanol-choline oxidoreductase C-terminal domain-containing protein n=1 Tax=Rhizobium lusitanum TaxID=293958 RepID=A0A6L9UEQ7_9HYPH|nr:GMC oxidoreductase [Rhizobium lusitanum]NEI74463.1 hypothetical protein [Rhizobium lusitanum]